MTWIVRFFLKVHLALVGLDFLDIFSIWASFATFLIYSYGVAVRSFIVRLCYVFIYYSLPVDVLFTQSAVIYCIISSM
jgi:hypothetical protein